MSSHIKQSHAQSFEQSQLPVLLEICERPMDETNLQTCPFCRQKDLVKKLMEHVAGHLEELALFVLPSGESEPRDEESSGMLSSMNSAEDDIYYTEETELAAAASAIVASKVDLTSTLQEATPIQSVPWPYTCEECGRVFDQIHKLK